MAPTRGEVGEVSQFTLSQVDTKIRVSFFPQVEAAVSAVPVLFFFHVRATFADKNTANLAHER